MLWLATAKEFLERCKRVWYVTRKPTAQEFLLVVKVSAAGILLLGFVGFLISMTLNIAKVFS